MNEHTKASNFTLANTIPTLSVILFTSALLLFILFNFSNIQFAFTQSNTSFMTNDSNRVLASIVSNLGSNNPDRMVGGFHAPLFNTSKPKPDIPAAEEKGFLAAEEKVFKIFYPSSWIKNTAPTGQFTGLKSIPIITFSPTGDDRSNSSNSLL